MKIPAGGKKEFRSLAAAQKFHKKLMAAGHTEAGVVYDAYSGRYRVLWKAKTNPSRKGRKMTKKQRKAKARRTGKLRTKARAVSAFMKKMNPAKAKRGYAFRVKRLRGGGISVVPVKLKIRK